jgi:hypothetical protein
MSSYSSEFKSAIISKLLGPKPPNIAELSKKAGIPQGTLYNWLRLTKSDEPMDIPKRVKRVSNWSKQERFKALLDTANMSEEQLNAYCRKNALFPAQIEEWKLELMKSLSKKEESENNHKVKKLESELKTMKQELNRKDKALAEASALLFLKKKVQELWGEPEDEE